VKLDVPEDQRACAEHSERQVIGYDWQETLEVVPPKLIAAAQAESRSSITARM